MWTKLVPITALIASVTFSGGTAHAEPTAPIGGEALGRHGVVAPAGVKKPPKSKATSYVVADVDTGQVLAAKDAHGRYLPASTLKALTALTLIPKLDKNHKVKPSQNACNQEGSAVGLSPKVTYKVDDLFKALMMASGNDAAMALAETNGGVAKTMTDMNAMAKRLQANDTVAKTPSGLDKPGQSSSAYDLALIARAGLANPDFRRYISTKVTNFPAPKGHYEISNHNKLLWRYDGMIGVKNGWTSKARASFVGAATRGGHTIVVSIMRHEGYFWDEVASLLDWGFSVVGKAQPVGQLVDPLPDPAPAAQAHATAPAAPPASPAVQAPLLETAASRQNDSTRTVGALVIGGGLLFGLLWVGYGIRRRRARSRV
ncbi:D-alanyl-D-alanine carboxypeptidase (penicillin-binding protein 5/6) [Nonomuraea maritima]|uniref:D-alanyl-D-alanine carboxypeptidase (Penicillin-binding protein 5/6) n=1 Tax=Nonomuraea maritima TaxID=683260 RepID=A0A1G9A641_9ACTN|nr:D-alanyl-D-alanine carboxypeptidase [Nonomuraea maritima]SDK22344.1 D-alanyl-D-alanine carboxypeptidase (penicillin-binding protein 5/6) [Nonomuraea maritima]